MAEIKLNVHQTKRSAPATTSSVEVTDEIYGKLGYTQQLLVNLYERYTGKTAMAGEYQGNKFLSRECAEEIAKVLL